MIAVFFFLNGGNIRLIIFFVRRLSFKASYFDLSYSGSIGSESMHTCRVLPECGLLKVYFYEHGLTLC